MDLSKITDESKVELCKRYFLIGFCCLPFVWLTNFVWFFAEAFCKPSTAHRKTIKKYVIFSGIGVTAWIVIITAWESTFQQYRRQGLLWADYLTFVFPKGRV